MRPALLFVAREARDVRRNPQVWPAYLLLPLVAIALPAVFAAVSPELARAAAERHDPVMAALVATIRQQPGFATLPLGEALARYTVRAFAGFLLLLPLVLSGTAAAFSIVGEKQQRTLEPLLATPITDRELLVGKLLAALVPGVAVTWAAGVVSALVVDVVSLRVYGAVFLPDRFWLVGLLVLGPLLGAASVLATMRVSARTTDPQAATQMSALMVLPAFLLFAGLLGKLITLSFPALLGACAVVLVVDLLLLRRNVRKFRREEILTRWK